MELIERTQTGAPGTAGVGGRRLRRAVSALAWALLLLLSALTDMLFVGRMAGESASALAGLGLCRPLILLLAAFAVLAGLGGARSAARSTGKDGREAAEKALGNSVTLLLILSAVLTPALRLLPEELLCALGAGGKALFYASAYLRVYSLGTVFVLLTLGLSAFVALRGFPTAGLLAMRAGVLANAALDALFIFGYDLGVVGAAWGTVASQALSAALLLAFFMGKKSPVRLRLTYMRPDKEALRGCLGAGFLPFLPLAAESATLAYFNVALFKYLDEAAVGAMALVSGVLALFFLPLAGFALGALPALRQGFAAKRPDRIKGAVLLLLGVCALYAFGLWGVVQLWPQGFVRLFCDDVGLLYAAASALRLYFAAACVLGVQLTFQAVLVALGRVKSAVFIALLHRALLISFIYVLPGLLLQTLGRSAVWLAAPAADAVSTLLAGAIFLPGFRGALAQSVDEHWQSGFFRFLRKAILLCTGPMKTVWEEPFSGAPSVFVCNHDRAFGPIAMNVQFEHCTNIRPWINAQVLSEREAPAYIREDYWWDPNKWYAPILSRTLAYFYALLIPPILRWADCVPVYHNTGVMSTLRASVKTLSDGKHLLLFPERPAGFRQYGTEISSGFVSVGKLYYGREKQSVHFYPAWVDWKGREIQVGKPLVYDPTVKYEEQAAAIASAIEDFFAQRAQLSGQ